MSESLKTDASPLLPHTMPARFLTDVLNFTATSIEGLAVIPAAHPLVVGGRAPAFLGIECGAQAAAALEALSMARAGTVAGQRIGRLVRIREAMFLTRDLPAGTSLTVLARMDASAPPLGIYSITVSVGEATAVTAIISTHASGQ